MTRRGTTRARVPQVSDDGRKADLLQGEYLRCGCDGTLAFHPQWLLAPLLMAHGSWVFWKQVLVRRGRVWC